MRSNFAWTFAGNVFAAASQWLILALLTKTTSDAITGQFVLALAICTPIFMFAGLDLRVLQATDGNNEFTFAEYRKLRWITAVSALVLVPIVCLFGGQDWTTFWVVCGVGVGKLAESIADIHNALLQKSERMDRVSRSLVAHGFLSCVGLVCGLLLTGELAIGVWAASAMRFVVLLSYDMPLVNSLQPKTIDTGDEDSTEPVRSGRLLKLAILGLPLAIKALLIALIANVTRYFVFGWGGLVALGIFGPIAMLMTAGTTVARAMNQSVAAKLGRLFRSNNRGGFLSLIRRLQTLYLGLGVCGVLVAWLAGPTLLSWLFREEFVNYHSLLVLVMIAAAFQYQGGALDMAMVAQRRIRILAFLSATTLAVLAGLCWWLIPIHGLDGAGYALLASRVPRVTALMWLVHFQRAASDCSTEFQQQRRAA
jgi:O-antigen/teichoic acid export membrane protein